MSVSHPGGWILHDPKSRSWPWSPRGWLKLSSPSSRAPAAPAPSPPSAGSPGAGCPTGCTSHRAVYRPSRASSHRTGMWSADISWPSRTCARGGKDRGILLGSKESSTECQLVRWTWHRARDFGRTSAVGHVKYCVTHLDASLPASHTPIPRLCISKSRHLDGDCSSRRQAGPMRWWWVVCALG